MTDEDSALAFGIAYGVFLIWRLDFDKLTKELKEFLSKQTKEDLEAWMKMDAERMGAVEPVGDYGTPQTEPVNEFEIKLWDLYWTCKNSEAREKIASLLAEVDSLKGERNVLREIIVERQQSVADLTREKEELREMLNKAYDELLNKSL